MPRFPLIKLMVVFAIIIIAVFLALSVPRLNREQDQAERLLGAIHAVLIETRAHFAGARNFSDLGAGYERAAYNPWGRFFVAASDEGFQIRLTHIPDSVCALLHTRLPRAEIYVIEDEDDIVLWDHPTDRSHLCEGSPNKRSNAIVLLFKR